MAAYLISFVLNNSLVEYLSVCIYQQVRAEKSGGFFNISVSISKSLIMAVSIRLSCCSGVITLALGVIPDFSCSNFFTHYLIAEDETSMALKASVTVYFSVTPKLAASHLNSSVNVLFFIFLFVMLHLYLIIIIIV
jgi:hypothetical protein